jgi:hypothetical protein
VFAWKESSVPSLLKRKIILEKRYNVTFFVASGPATEESMGVTFVFYIT